MKQKKTLAGTASKERALTRTSTPLKQEVHTVPKPDKTRRTAASSLRLPPQEDATVNAEAKRNPAPAGVSKKHDTCKPFIFSKTRHTRYT